MFGVILPAFHCPKKCLFWLFIFLTLSTLLFIPPVLASVVINEFQVKPSGSSQWIELYNNGGGSEDISGWVIDDEGSPDSKYTIASGTVLYASTCLSFQSGKFYWNPSSSDSVRLISGDNVVDKYTYSKSPESGVSFGRDPDGTGSFVSFTSPTRDHLNSSGLSCLASATPTPSPTTTPIPIPSPTAAPTATPTPTPTPTPVSYPSGIYLTEFMPNSNSGEKEWVEIYNSNSSSVELTDWKIDDKEGGSSPEDFTVTLAAQVYKQLFFSSSKLNNDSDTVRLLRPDLTVVDSYSYSVSHKGNSWAKNNDGSWFETSAVTPNEANKFIPVGGFAHKEGIAELKKLTLGSKIDLTANVSLPLDIFDEKEFYVIDDYSGIKISVTSLQSIKLKLGDKIHVASTIEESYSEKYIKSETYEIIESNLKYPDPWEIETGEITEASEGRLVKVSGKYKESDGDNFYITDGTGLAKIYLKPSAGIIKLKMTSGDEMEVQGIVSQYGFLKDGKPNYRLMPRFQSDLRNLTSEKKLSGTVLGAATQLPVTGNTTFFPSLMMIGLGLVLKIVLKFSREVY